MTQRAVVHIRHTFEGDALRINAKRVSLLQVVIHQCHQQVVGTGDGMKVPGEVQVDFIHGQHLRVATTGGPALHPEAWAHRRFTQGDHGFTSGSR